MDKILNISTNTIKKKIVRSLLIIINWVTALTLNNRITKRWSLEKNVWFVNYS